MCGCPRKDDPGSPETFGESISFGQNRDKSNSFGIADYNGKIDFVLLFAVVHEIPDIPALFDEISKSMKSGSSCLIAEPKGHVSMKDFEETLAIAKQKGLNKIDSPTIQRSLTVLLRKG